MEKPKNELFDTKEKEELEELDIFFNPKIVIVMPALNEEQGIGSVIDDIRKTLEHY